MLGTFLSAEPSIASNGLKQDFEQVANRLLSLCISLIMTVQKNASGKLLGIELAANWM